MSTPSPAEHIQDAGSCDPGSSGSVQLLGSLAYSYIIRLLAWSAILTACIVAFVVLLASAGTHPNPVGHSLLEGYGALIAAGIVYCLWVQYCVTAERKLLLATIAFSGIVLAQLAYALTTAFHPSLSPLLRTLSVYYRYGWQFAAVCLLAIGAETGARNNAQNFHRNGARALAGSLVLSLCLAGGVLKLAVSWPRLSLGVPFQDEARMLWHYVRPTVTSGLLPSSLVLAGILAAFFIYARSYVRHESRFSHWMSKFLLLTAFAQGALLASGSPYSLLWWFSHTLNVAAMLILLVELGAEFGASYSDAHARIEHLEAVHHMSSQLTNTLDLRVVLLALVSDMASMLSAKFASVMRADDAGEMLTTEATYGLPDSPLRPRELQRVEGQGRPAFYSGHTAKAFREKHICLVDDVYTDVEFVPWQILAQHDGYAVSIPLVYQDVALGVLNLFFEEHIQLNDERMRLFQTLAGAAAVAIANAQLYERALQIEHLEAGNWLSNLRLRLAS